MRYQTEAARKRKSKRFEYVVPKYHANQGYHLALHSIRNEFWNYYLHILYLTHHYSHLLISLMTHWNTLELMNTFLSMVLKRMYKKIRVNGFPNLEVVATSLIAFQIGLCRIIIFMLQYTFLGDNINIHWTMNVTFQTFIIAFCLKTPKNIHSFDTTRDFRTVFRFFRTYNGASAMYRLYLHF